jgi:hypothetical protein
VGIAQVVQLCVGVGGHGFSLQFLT